VPQKTHKIVNLSVQFELILYFFFVFFFYNGNASDDQNDSHLDGPSRKREVNGGPLYATVETLIVTDYSCFVAHQRYAGTTNVSVVLLNMKFYFAHLLYLVCKLDSNNDKGKNPVRRASANLTL
jgi:hypothetical protein